MKSKKKRQLREKAWQRKVVKECRKTARELKRSIDRYFHGILLPAEERLFRDIRQMFQEKAANMSIGDKLIMALKIHLAVPNECLLYMDEAFSAKLMSVLAECVFGNIEEKSIGGVMNG